MSLTCGMPFATSTTVSKRCNATSFKNPASRTRYSSKLLIVSGSQSSNESKKATKVLRSVLGSASTSGTRNLTALALSNYLRGLGFARETDIRRVVDIVMNPNSLYGTKGGKQPINPYARSTITVAEVEKVIDYFVEFGFSGSEVNQLVTAFPQVLCYPVEERIKLLFDYLSDTVGFGHSELRNMILHRPNILGLTGSQVEQMIGFFLANGSSKEEIVRLLQTSL
eukprot:jgi/Picsp_1/285/NSC_00284-R1_protein